MAQLSYREAVAAGIAQEMRRDERVVLFGEDTAAAGGVFKTTVGLFEEFGPKRVKDTPISELAILGAAMGAAMTGLRPIAEIMFSDFLACCWDYVANEIAKTRYMSDGQITAFIAISLDKPIHAKAFLGRDRGWRRRASPWRRPGSRVRSP